MVSSSRTSLALVLLLAGCGRRFVDDAGVVCLTAEETDPPQQVEDGGTLTLFATGFGGCHMRDLAVTCEATVEGDVIDVTTHTTWVRTEPFAVGCEAILLLSQATCQTPPLEAGAYTVRYVDNQLPLEVPGELSGCLEGLPR